MRTKYKVLTTAQKFADFLEVTPEILPVEILSFQRKEIPIYRIVEQGGIISLLSLFVRNVILYEQGKSLDSAVYEYYFGFG